MTEKVNAIMSPQAERAVPDFETADLIEELRAGVPVAEETDNGGELYDIEAANETMAQAAHVLSKSHISAQISRADRAHEWAIREAQHAVACEQRVTDLRISLNDIIALDHHRHGPESRATKIARAALLRDDDMVAR